MLPLCTSRVKIIRSPMIYLSRIPVVSDSAAAVESASHAYAHCEDAVDDAEDVCPYAVCSIFAAPVVSPRLSAQALTSDRTTVEDIAPGSSLSDSLRGLLWKGSSF